MSCQFNNCNSTQLTNDRIIRNLLKSMKEANPQTYYPKPSYYTNTDRTPTVQRKDNCQQKDITRNACGCLLTCQNGDQDLRNDKLIDNILKQLTSS